MYRDTDHKDKRMIDTMHRDTFELVQREYYYLKIDMPTCTDIQQIWNTIQYYGPDLKAVVNAVKRGDRTLLDNIKKYPQESYKFRNSLEWSADFYERVQEIDAKLRLRDLDKTSKERVIEQIEKEAA